MPGSGERAYVYAKACGIIGRSFVGKRILQLGALSRLSELDRLVFSLNARDLPERELLVDLERRIIGRTAKQIVTIIDSFARPPEFLVRLLRSYEYGDIKNLINALAAGEPKAPVFTDIGRFRTLRVEAYPDIKAMLRDTEFDWLLKEDLQNPASSGGDQGLLQTRLDRQYYTSLWGSLLSLPRNDRKTAEKLLSEEISLRNAAWALRLRTYYGMSPQEIRERLVLIESQGALAADALSSLSLALDNPSDWASWKRAGFLNPARPGESWTVDPRCFQNAASEYLYRLARVSFRRRPFSLDTVTCFIKLKQFEEDLLTSVAEGLGLGMPAGDIFALLEVAP
ncbi:MAG: V-type ATPase subunit [Treponema sp.]|jgi:vacuolar-type H+-ATPase subunit C/Vma6|nr:V-type ATPase subunit [Treponema sp.]